MTANHTFCDFSHQRRKLMTILKLTVLLQVPHNQPFQAHRHPPHSLQCFNSLIRLSNTFQLILFGSSGQPGSYYVFGQVSSGQQSQLSLTDLHTPTDHLLTHPLTHPLTHTHAHFFIFLSHFHHPIDSILFLSLF